LFRSGIRLSDQIRFSADPFNDFDIVHVVDAETWVFWKLEYNHICKFLYFAVVCY